MVDAVIVRNRRHSEDTRSNEPRKRRCPLHIRDIFGHHSTLPHNCSFSSRQVGFGDDSSFTFRLVRQESGYAARSLGEEKILLFRSDRPGAVAKVVFSSLPPIRHGGSDSTIDAKIHCLHVKEEYRGYDLGGLLFREALSSLRSRYLTNYDTNGKNDPLVYESTTFSSSNDSTIIKCHIDAEEDDSRHNKLVRFYEKLGCSIKSRAKIQYLNSSDGRTYRKVPMQIVLEGQGAMTSLLWESETLLPLFLRFNETQLVSVKSTRDPIRWLLVDDGSGNLQFRTTSGFYLTCKDDTCYLQNTSWEKNDCAMESFSRFFFECDAMGNFVSEARTQKWFIRFASTGLYLSVDASTGNLSCSTEPTCWQSEEQDISLSWLGNDHEPSLVDSDSESREQDSRVDSTMM